MNASTLSAGCLFTLVPAAGRVQGGDGDIRCNLNVKVTTLSGKVRASAYNADPSRILDAARELWRKSPRTFSMSVAGCWYWNARR